MSRFDKDSAYLKVRRWIDHDIATRFRSPSVTFSSVVTIGLAFALAFAGDWLSRTMWLGLLLLSSAWTGFVFWRVSRIVRAMTIKGDRQYDQKTKFTLPPEYANSESVSAASRRRQRRR